MLGSLVLSLREGLEIALVIGIVLGALRKMQRPELRGVVWAGALSAALVSLGMAVGLHWVGAELHDPAEAIYEGLMLLTAAGLLTWMIFWMQGQARQVKGILEAGVRQAAAHTGRRALFLMAFVSVLREGIELALFLAAAAVTADGRQILLGAGLGLAAAAGLGWALFAASLRLNLRRFFLFTGALLVLFAGGLLTQGVAEFVEVGWVPAIIPHVWNLNSVLSESSGLGSVLKALFGYNASPSLTALLAYLGYFAVIFIAVKRREQPAPAAA